MKTKVTVVGGGNVGAAVAQGIALKELADVVVVDIVEGVPQGKTLDLMETAPVEKYDAILSGTNSYDGTENSDVVVITAGLPRKPGMSRDDLLWKNEEIVAGVTQVVVKRSPDCIIIVVSNPLDAMCEVARRVSAFPRERVIGMAGVLASARRPFSRTSAGSCRAPRTCRASTVSTACTSACRSSSAVTGWSRSSRSRSPKRSARRWRNPRRR